MKKHFLSFLLVMLSPLSMLGQIEISHIDIQQVAGNVLRYQVRFTTSELSQSYVEYGAQQFTGVSAPQLEHELLVIGLRAATDYEFILHAFNTKGESESLSIPVSTSTIPSDIVEAADTLYNDTSATSGYILTDARGPNIASQVRLFDRAGRLVWYDYTKEVGSPCLGNNYSNRNTILEIYGDCQTVIELNFFGDTIQKVNISAIPGNFQVHHDMYINDVGNLVLLVAEARAVDKSMVGGRADAIVVGDGYLEFSPAGELIHSWSIFDHLDPLTSQDAGSFWDQTFGEPAEDWTHANSLSQDADGHYLMSLNGLDRAIKIHRETGEIIWSLGRDGDFSFDPADATFRNQHTFWGLGNNRYTVFDNQGAGSFSRGMEFELDEETGVAKLVFIQDADSTLSTGIVGSTYRYDNGHMLSSFGRAGAIEEVDSTGRVIWYRNEGTILNYRSYFVPYLYEPLPSLQLLDTVICQNERPFIPKTNLSGGYFEGGGIMEGLLVPDVLAPGVHEIVYQYAHLRDTFSITIVEAPTLPNIQQIGAYLSTDAVGDLQWLLDGLPIEGATADSLLIADNGDYQVRVTNEAGCDVLSNVFSTQVSSTIVPWEERISIFPNPSLGTCWITASGVTIERIEISAITGQRIRTIHPLNHQDRYYLEGLQAGAYWITVVTGQQRIGRKLIVF